MLLAYLEHSRKGATSFDLEKFFNWPHQTVSSILSILERDALICRNGETRTSPSGREAYVYFGLSFVPVEKRLEVIRKGVRVFDWTDVEKDRISDLVKTLRNAVLNN